MLRREFERKKADKLLRFLHYMLVIVVIACTLSNLRCSANHAIIDDPSNKYGTHPAEASSLSSPPSTPTSSAPCALLFFGLLKQPDLVVPSILENIVRVNPNCDVFAHTYNVTTAYNPRNNEFNESIDTTAVSRIAPDHSIMDTEEEFLAARNVTYYRQFFPEESREWYYPVSMDNMIKQWHSIERVWNYMNDRPHNYTRVGLFRIDLLYTDPIDINVGADAVVPYFVTASIRGRFKFMNDRMFYGTYENAKHWAADRFSSVATYLQREDDYWPPYLHSEIYLGWLFRKTPLELRLHCGKRVRATGEVLDDCKKHRYPLMLLRLEAQRAVRNFYL